MSIATNEPYPRYTNTKTGADMIPPHDRVRWLAGSLELSLLHLVDMTKYPKEKALLIEYHEALIPLFQQFMDDRRLMIDRFIEINGEFRIIDSFCGPDEDQHPLILEAYQKHLDSSTPLWELVKKARKLENWVRKRDSRRFWGLPDGEFDEVSKQYPLTPDAFK